MRFFVLLILLPFLAFRICGEEPVSAADKNAVPPPNKPPVIHEERAKTGKTFRFKGGERISVEVARDITEPALQFQQLVTTDGYVSSLRFGLVNVLGLTIEEASGVIAIKYREITGYKDPIVAISLTSAPDNRVYVQGQVAQPKTAILPFDADVTLGAVLAEAGGVTQDADITRIKILRRLPGGMIGTEEVDARGFAEPGVKFAGPELKSGDNVIVPLAEAFSVLGEVKNPGIVTRRVSRVPIGHPIYLSHVIAATGGLTSKADRKSIHLIRVNKDGTRTKKTYDFNAIERGEASQDPELKDGDQISVQASEGIVVLGAVNAPGIYYIPVGPPTLLRLFALSGGMAPYAKRRLVQVVHKDKPGAPVVVNMQEIIERGRTDLDLEIGPGDLIFVPGEPQ